MKSFLVVILGFLLTLSSTVLYFTNTSTESGKLTTKEVCDMNIIYPTAVVNLPLNQDVNLCSRPKSRTHHKSSKLKVNRNPLLMLPEPIYAGIKLPDLKDLLDLDTEALLQTIAFEDGLNMPILTTEDTVYQNLEKRNALYVVSVFVPSFQKVSQSTQINKLSLESNDDLVRTIAKTTEDLTKTQEFSSQSNDHLGTSGTYDLFPDHEKRDHQKDKEPEK